MELAPHDQVPCTSATPGQTPWGVRLLELWPTGIGEAFRSHVRPADEALIYIAISGLGLMLYGISAQLQYVKNAIEEREARRRKRRGEIGWHCMRRA